MTEEPRADTHIETSFDDVLAQYIASEEAGTPLDRQELLARYPGLAAELREFFANRDQLQQLAAPLLAAGDPGRHPGHPVGKVRYFGDYELVDEIAAGGMGIVFKARQVSLNRIVAVKMILRGTLASEDDVKRFRAEAEAAANLQHPGIVAIHEVGLHEGQHYFSMDFVLGKNLAQLPRDQPLTTRQAAEYVLQAAEALHYAHQQGTLHRDIKPSNLLVDHQGRVRITDFGLAKRIANSRDLTLTGQILGTPSYMPPEQALGKRSLVAAASDIYSLGAVLYELLTNRPPFRGESPAETLRQVELLDPISARLLNPAVARDLETICFKCLEKEPHKRYGTAQLLADDLGRYLRGDSILAKPASRIERLVRWCRKRPAVASLVTTVAVLLLVVIPAMVLLYKKQIDVELERTQQAERNTQDRLATSYLHLARASRLSKSVGQRENSLQAVEDSLQILDQLGLPNYEYRQRLADLRTETIAALTLPDLRVLHETRISGIVSAQGADPELKLYACILQEELSPSGTGGSLVIRRLADDVEIEHFPGCHVRTALFSPDGKLVASPDGKIGRLNVWQLGESNPVLTTPWSAESAFAFSPSGRWLAVGNQSGSANGSVDLYDLPTRSLALEIKTPSLPIQIAFQPSENHLAVTCGPQLILIVFALKGGAQAEGLPRQFQNRAPIQVERLKTQAEGLPRKFQSSAPITLEQMKNQLKSGAQPEGLPRFSGVNDIAWDPEGRRLALQFSGGPIRVLDFEARKIVASLSGDHGGGVMLKFDATGNVLASVGWREELRFWKVATGELLLSTHNECINSRFHSQRPWIGPIRRGSRIGVSEFLFPSVFRKLVRFKSNVFFKDARFSISPDNRLLAVQYSDGVAIWELSTGRELGYLPIGAAAPVFEPSGAMLTMTSQALLRWPITEESGSLGTLRIGPPQRLLGLSSPKHRLAISGDGHILALCQEDEAWVWRPGRSEPPVALPHVDVRYLDVSSDGRWVVTGSHIVPTVKIWDAATGKLVHELHTTATRNDVRFSPDGRWLTTSGDGNRLWRTDTWEAGPTLRTDTGGHTAGAFASFSTGNSLMAIDPGDATLRLVDPETGNEKACLTNPGHSHGGYCDFTPDGRRIITCNNESNAVEVWDLVELRAELNERGLDWNDPPYTPLAAYTPIRELQIVGDVASSSRTWAEAELKRASTKLEGNAPDAEAFFRRGHAHLHLGQIDLAFKALDYAAEHGFDSLAVPRYEPWLDERWRQIRLRLADRQERLKQNPENDSDLLDSAWEAASLHEYALALSSLEAALRSDSGNRFANNLMARILLFGPERLRDAQRGFDHAQRAQSAKPIPLDTTILAAALYRTGRGAEAKRLLSDQKQPPAHPHDLFLLALVYQQDGNTSLARELYQLGCQRLDIYNSSSISSLQLLDLIEACRLRAEAEEALQAD